MLHAARGERMEALELAMGALAVDQAGLRSNSLH
jgi:hypothetical protein